MKCEYCENELHSNATEACPFCGSALASSEYHSCVQAQEDDDAIDVICPHCQSVYSISPSEWGEYRECEVCHESFPLTYGTLSDAQSNIIWKTRIAGIVDKWRHGNDALFSARQSMGDILLKPGEVLYERVEGVVLSETRGVRRTVSERSSHRNYEHDYWDARARRTGEHYNYQGHSETATEYEYRNLDNGVLYLTSRRLLFIGNQMQRYVNLERITSFVPDLEGSGEIRISEESKQKILRFILESVGDGSALFRFSLVLKALRDANFKRFLLTAPTDEVAKCFMEFSYFCKLIPSPTRLLQATQESDLPQEVPVSPAVGSIIRIGGVLATLVILSFIVSSKIGVSFWTAVGILVGGIGIIAFICCDGVRYQVGSTAYTDISELSFMAGQIASFKAGMRGDGIVTAWDKANGTWDAMVKESGGVFRL